MYYLLDLTKRIVRAIRQTSNTLLLGYSLNERIEYNSGHNNTNKGYSSPFERQYKTGERSEPCCLSNVGEDLVAKLNLNVREIKRCGVFSTLISKAWRSISIFTSFKRKRVLVYTSSTSVASGAIPLHHIYMLIYEPLVSVCEHIAYGFIIASQISHERSPYRGIHETYMSAIA
jgi:hypothetical protein